MSKLHSIVLAVLVLAMGIAPVSAALPDPNYYEVVQGGNCLLPDGNALPTRVNGVKQSFDWPAPLHLSASCLGELPKGAPRPKETMKLTFAEAGFVCKVQVGRAVFDTVDYGATVYPNGVTEITCHVDLE